MSLASKSQPQSVASSAVYQVPGLDSHEMDSTADKTFERYLSNTAKRNGKGVSIVWFRNDLRVLDNEALFKAWVSSQAVLPVYCIDPRLFQTTYYFGFPKTGALRAQFINECLADLKKNLMKKGLNLLIQHGKPEDILPSLTKAFGAHTVYAHKETCSEELQVERSVARGLRQVVLSTAQGNSSRSSSTHSPKLQLIWGSTLYHLDDIPFSVGSLPDSVEAKCTIRGCIRLPTSLGPPPSVDDWGIIPSVVKGMRFLGGETAALSRDLLKIYKETRNEMLGPDYSTKFSPWLASGSLSPRVLFELIWRDYFRFISIKYGNSLFHLGGPRKVEKRWHQDQKMFETWRNGCTGYPLIDANMKELSASGFMSNRGRQIVCSFLVRDMGIDWRMGAEWFETCLLDYDPCSNYGNWTYGAGVGNDPREDRYFSIPKQAKTYDPDGEHVAFWVPELLPLPKEKRNFPGKSYIEQVVPLKFGSSNKHHSQRSKYGGRHSGLGNR
ncbi:Cryptochrome DASH, chloroplastic/mitochondrial [Gossypium arboreum]|uniref:Cryptochrome DASH n=1 Tax=Gossypium arboreum TaxID=29729 RepID=A0A0B0NIV9_GOSAR|nr:Cryptochrome DASH, chloroplastic/mitochondrial [Gossypium arboreum]